MGYIGGTAAYIVIYLFIASCAIPMAKCSSIIFLLLPGKEPFDLLRLQSHRFTNCLRLLLYSLNRNVSVNDPCILGYCQRVGFDA